jgi:hypothetical protein
MNVKKKIEHMIVPLTLPPILWGKGQGMRVVGNKAVGIVASAAYPTLTPNPSPIRLGEGGL